jgi:hypothetical protein
VNVSPNPHLKALLQAMSASIPDAVAASSVAIVVANRPFVRHLGSGTLLAVADRRFVVTAAHVIRAAQSTVGISGGSNNNFIATAGTWLLSAQSNEDEDDPFDLAVYPLEESQITPLEGRTFLRIGDVSFESDLSRAFFVVSGFPSIWSTETSEADEPMKLRLLQYSTYAYGGSTVALQGYDARHHVLLDAKPEHVFDSSGSAIEFRTRSGYAAQMPQDLRGISGCSVWMIGDLSIPCHQWRLDHARLVAVETGVFPGRAAIKATRWNAVTTLLYSAFMDLRSTIELYANGQK